MSRIILIIIFHPVYLFSQNIIKEHFDEVAMNNALFIAINDHIKKINKGDSITLSCVIQDVIMSKNHSYIKDNCSSDIRLLHNPVWLGRPNNDLPDSLRTMLIDELTRNNPNSEFLRTNWIDQIKQYGSFSYTEILGSILLNDSKEEYRYSQLADLLIKGWNDSPPHATYMNANYKNAVLGGVTSYYDRKTRKLTVSIVFIN